MNRRGFLAGVLALFGAARLPRCTTPAPPVPTASPLLGLIDDGTYIATPEMRFMSARIVLDPYCPPGQLFFVNAMNAELDAVTRELQQERARWFDT